MIRPLGLRHKPTMDWGMRARARNQIHWDRYWFQLEANRYEGALMMDREHQNARREQDIEVSGQEHNAGESEDDNKPNDAGRDGTIPNGANGTLNTTKSFTGTGSGGCEGMSTEGSPTISPTSKEDDTGYFYFRQILNHFQEPSSSPRGGSEGRSGQETFQQHYHVSAEFYKPGGPIILWIPGESPLHSLFLRRGLAYELANATSGLLVALEHRFYGNSIPRHQDSLSSRGKNDFEMRTTRRKTRWGQNDAMMTWLATGSHHGAKSDPELGQLDRTSKIRTKGSGSSLSSFGGSGTGARVGIENFLGAVNRQGRRKGKGKVISMESEHSTTPLLPPTHTTPTPTYSTRLSDAPPTPTPSTSKEGLPLDLLKYLSVDQSIEDIAYFMDNFQKLQPAYFAQPTQLETQPLLPINVPKPNSRTNTTRWILAGCSYSGNLAAWTRQRYPNKVFAAFASSAPVRSALDFFEYTTSQTDILGKQCSRDLSLARDFLDGALQMTDEFMVHMALDAHGDDTSANADSNNKTVASEGPLIQPMDSSVNNSTHPPVSTNKLNDRQTRQAAKLKVLSWFSPDFARDYALDGEEAHAAGWVWWTVASAVQYNTVVGPPSSTLMETVPRTTVDILCDAMALARSPSSPDSASVPPILYAKALAAWFKDQQYFTPTKTEDLQPSDLDPNSVQNLAGVAWLWQTCSELGYLQTAHPSSCCCPCSSSPLSGPTMSDSAITLTGAENSPLGMDSFRNSTAMCEWEEAADFSKDRLSYPAMCKASVSTLDESVRKEGCATSSPILTASTCQPCQCYAATSLNNESVFSRLLTLEAAWQECQLYFSNPKTGPGGDSTTPSPSPQPGISDDGSDGAKNIVNDNTSPNPPPISSSQASPLSQQSSMLKGYPDVENNVNQKFHGWEIAQDLYPLATVSNDSKFLRLKKKREQVNRPLRSDDPVMTLIQQGRPQLSQSSGQLQHSGRYYFTNGENDPWKELTLASAKALDYLKTHRAEMSLRHPVEKDPRGVLSTDSLLSSKPRTHRYRHRKPRYHHHHRHLSDRHVPPQESVDQLPDSDSPEVAVNTKETNTEHESAFTTDDARELEQNVIRIIPGASHCQDILYESTDRNSVALWTERQHVLKTFVQWIEDDVRREKQEWLS
ncbi:hypothetical protein BGZ59_000094 [Podila verticillata]|nr:hypothetical protein BGZ59_000094 [Podila verticillata]